MVLPDELGVTLNNYAADSETTIADIALRSSLAAVLSVIPFAGSAIYELSNGLAQKRAQERINTVFEQLRDSLGRLGQEKIDRTFFHSEEFQTLLYLLLERLHTTHDTDKLRMFGNALANAGNSEFKDDPREQYVRLLRELSLTDLKVLNHENLKNWTPHVSEIEYAPEILSSLFRLQGMGLVLQKLKLSDLPDERSGDDYVRLQAYISHLATTPPTTTFYLSDFGGGFLRFISQTAGPPSPSGTGPECPVI